MSKFNVGDKVRYVGEEHTGLPEFYPAVGTVGVVDKIDSDGHCWVQWPKGTTSDSDCWCCDDSEIELATENEKLSNEEIWEMLKPKMKKNKLKPIGVCTKWEGRIPKNFYTYSEDDVHNAIAIAYRSGYERAMKGRPFKIGEKKKNGHWEPINPNNLPKEGTKVRYARKHTGYSLNPHMVQLGDVGTFYFDDFDKEPDMKLNKKDRYGWVCFSNPSKYLDMWVEDDE